MAKRTLYKLLLCISLPLPLMAFIGTAFTGTAFAGTAFAGPALLIDATSGKILYAQNIDDQWRPASLTKIMTAYLAFEALKTGKLTLESKLTTSALARREPPSKIGLPLGATIAVRLGLKALIIKSANDVAVMFAEAIGGTHDAFVQKMNATARRLGMSRTHFDNPNGLPSKGQYTTARDLAILTQAVLRDFPQYGELWRTKSFKMGKRRLRSFNGLLKTFNGADGFKTGFICDSGYNMVATATRDGRRLMAVVLGALTLNQRRTRAARLLEHGFRTYEWKQLFGTANLGTLPLDPRATGPTSVRKIVRNPICGYRAPARKRRLRNATTVARAKARKARLRRARLARIKKSGQKNRPVKKPAKTVKSVKPKKPKKKG